MKARRSMQIAVGVVALVAALAVVVITLLFAATLLFPNLFETANFTSGVFIDGFKTTADSLNMANIYYLLPILAYGLPALLLIIGALLLFSHYKGKQGKYIGGNVVVLVGMTILCAYSIIFAKDLLGANALILQCSAAGLLALTVLFVGLALGLKVTQPSTDDEAPAETEEQPTEVAAETTNDIATEYVPEEVSVKETLDEVYGEEPKHVSDNKLSTLRMLLDVGAISEEEYLKLLESYLK